MTWLIDTMVTTGVLMALVLVLRRPVARWFGPGMAYALWALPLLRLIMPPLVLPETQESIRALGDPAIAAATAASALGETSPIAQAPIATVSSFPSTWLIVAWLAGAAAFIAWRIAGYIAMRRNVLAMTRPVGEAGAVRLVESPAVTSPVTFGLRDKVVALPPGFMASEDRAARDLAIAHELEHHAGRDLAVNWAMQPLLALHWFNPLAWIGWRAMRRDQEAACDARVLAGSSLATRAHYARLIASFAHGPRLGLAAPMACPMFGEKSIVHRLRSLTMTQPSARRGLLGRLLIGAGVLALPLTATISYAASEAPPVPPAPPAAPDAPAIPDAPQPPEPVAGKHQVIMIERHDAGSGKLYTHEVERNGKRYVLKTDRPMSDAEFNRKMAEVDSQAAQAKRQAESAARAADAAGKAASEGSAYAVSAAANAERQTDAALANAEASVCRNGEKAYDFSASSGGGREQHEARIRVCAMQHALDGLRKARSRIAADPSMETGIKQQILSSMDEQIERLGKDS